MEALSIRSSAEIILDDGRGARRWRRREKRLPKAELSVRESA